ncbi:MAG: alpha/beta hydrolase-fold protein [Terracidiphilus sp.]|jgi:enterochelin esterase-like enzyme
MKISGWIFPLVFACFVVVTPLVPSETSFGQAAARPARPLPPARDPRTPGYVAATELPDGAVPDPNQNGNFILGPTHTPAPELADPNRPLDGTVVEFTMNSEDSEYYPGIARNPDSHPMPDAANPARLVGVETHPAPYVRKVAVYVPKGYVPGKEMPFIVGADGPDRLLFAALDALIAEHKLPPTVAVSIGNGGGDAQGSERGLEYDTTSDKYAEFVEYEVLPAVENHAHVKLTHDPNGRATTGNSSGGSCALAMAWYHPDWYHRVLTYSGTYVNQQWPWNPATPHGAWGFHEQLIPHSARKPLRIWMEVGDRDNLNPNTMRDEMHDWVLANERMAQVLAEKHYPYQFVFARNAVHVDRAVRQQTLPEALEWVWRGYKAK